MTDGVILVWVTLGHRIAIHFILVHLHENFEVLFLPMKTGRLAILTFDFSFFFLALDIFNTEDEKDNNNK